jgi:anion-transporting  ArsA/GET3 family ATPase
MPGLLDKRFWVVSGKGGVGKSSVAAALALASARAGRRTLICEVNTDERVAPLLGHGPVGPEVARLEENLWAVDMRPQESMRQYVLMTLKLEALYRAVFENRLIRNFVRFIPSLQELVLLGKATWHVRERHKDGSWVWDTVVLDAPATGHAISFFSVPQVLIDTVPPGPIQRDAQIMRALLVDPAVSAAVLVSLPEELPVNETLELSQALRERVKMPIEAGVLNTFVGPRFGDAELEGLSRWPDLAALAREHRAEAERSRVALERLQSGLERPVHRIPRLFTTSFGRPEIETIAESLSTLVSGGSRP